MNNTMTRLGLILVVVTLLSLPAVAIDAAIKDVRNELDQIAARGNTPSDAAELSAVVKRAQAVIADGESTVAKLTSKNLALEKETADLRQIQTALTSGLIGAIVTAIVAIAGVIVKTMGSRIDRDIKRLELAEKIASLASKGVSIPEDIAAIYKRSAPPSA